MKRVSREEGDSLERRGLTLPESDALPWLSVRDGLLEQVRADLRLVTKGTPLRRVRLPLGEQFGDASTRL